MMNISIYDILKTGGISYRILYIQDEYVVGCRMDITKLIIEYISLAEIKEKLLSGEWTVEKNPASSVVNTSIMDDALKEKFLLYKKCMKDISDVYGPTFIGLTGKTTKREANSIMAKYGMKLGVFRKICRKYIQSGCDDNSLIDKRAVGFAHSEKKYEYKKRTGRPSEYGEQNEVIIDEVVKERFTEALKDYKSGRQTTYRGAYEDMVKKYYMVETRENGTVTWESLPDHMIPSYRQFTNFCRKHLSEEEKDSIRTSKAEQRNYKRLLLSDSMKGVFGPGDMVEVDALESDISLVSERDREQSIGRGILYLMIDVWTRAIIAMSVGFENNSVLAITDLLMNLADDKQEFAGKYGISFSPELWPSEIIPHRMRVDRGADFRSDKLSEILNKLGVERLLEPAATGSLKGIVEQEFRQIQFNQNDIVESKGLIEKRHDSKHHKEAKLTIREFTMMCINYVLAHNQKYLNYYKMNKEMLDNQVQPIPAVLWQYGCKKYGSPRPIANKEQFYWDLMTPATASLNREGLKWKDLHYLNAADKVLLHEMYLQQQKVKKVDVRYDPRDIGCLYYLRNNSLMAAPLNQDKFGNAGFSGMTYKEYMDYRKAKKKMDATGKKHNRDVSIMERTNNKEIVDGVRSERYANTSDMKEERELERQNKNKSNAISNRLPDNQLLDNKTANDQNAPEGVKPSINAPLDDLDFEQALLNFEEKE